MKKAITGIILILLILTTYFYRSDIISLFNKEERKHSILVNNDYTIKNSFNYLKNASSFDPKNKIDIRNIYYTILNSGMNSFIFYCNEEYENCINDVVDLANDQQTLSNINNFVHPYNSFKRIETEYDSFGKVIVNITKAYSQDEITTINNKVNEVLKEITDTDPTKQILKIHDYIIKNTKYDTERSEKNIVNYKSDTAYGTLIEGYSVCGGYADSMMIFLEKLNIKSTKISSENHIWNHVYLNNKYLHLDLTWDDPVTSNKTDIIEYDYFLINDEELEKLASSQHNYNKEIYQ